MGMNDVAIIRGVAVAWEVCVCIYIRLLSSLLFSSLSWLCTCSCSCSCSTSSLFLFDLTLLVCSDWCRRVRPYTAANQAIQSTVSLSFRKSSSQYVKIDVRIIQFGWLDAEEFKFPCSTSTLLSSCMFCLVWCRRVRPTQRRYEQLNRRYRYRFERVRLNSNRSRLM